MTYLELLQRIKEGSQPLAVMYRGILYFYNEEDGGYKSKQDNWLNGILMIHNTDLQLITENFIKCDDKIEKLGFLYKENKEISENIKLIEGELKDEKN